MHKTEQRPDPMNTRLLQSLLGILFLSRQRKNFLQDHKANGIHDFAVPDDSPVLQKTLQENEPAKISDFEKGQ